MNRIPLLVVACLGLVALGGKVEAGVGCHYSGCHRVVVPYAPAPVVVPPVPAIPVYSGCQHFHWQYFAWSRKFGCRCYFCPKARVWYYWHPDHAKYYPLENIGRTPPPAVPVPPDGPARPVPFTRDQLPPSPDEAVPGSGDPPPVPGPDATPAPMPGPFG